ncbi:T9SS type A sorting domain-containing protein [candidate division WOR-3 bacterium]|nr:T9SS type A sorting domain-containing protein [candidate division WOR-3 bacterium]
MKIKITALAMLIFSAVPLVSGKFTVDYDYPEIWTENVLLDGRAYTVVHASEALPVFGEPGTPQLPAKSFLFILPPEGSYSFDVSFFGGKTIRLENPILPSPEWTDGELVYEQAAQHYGESYPVKSYKVSEPFKMGYWRLVRVETYPCLYSDGKLTTASKVRIEATFSDYVSSSSPSQAWQRIISGLVENPSFSEIFVSGNEGRMSFFSNAPYYRMSLFEEGLYEVTGSDLENAGANLGAIDPATLSVRCGPIKALSWSLTDTIYDSFPIEIPIQVEDGNDGRFDPGDRIVFYASSLRGYDKNTFPYSVSVYNSPWSDTAVYWLTWGSDPGKRLENQSSQPFPGSFVQNSFLDTVHVETDSINPSQSGLRFVHSEIVRNSGDEVARFTRTYIISDPAQVEAYMQLHVFSDVSDSHHLRVKLNGTQIGISEWQAEFSNNPRIITFPCTGVLVDGNNTQEIELFRKYPNTKDFILYDLTDILYQRRYRMSDGMLVFGVNAGVQDTVLGFSTTGVNQSGFFLWNIDDPYDPQGIINYSISGDTLRFAWRGDSLSRFIAVNSLKKPVDIRYSDPFAIKRITGADYIIIAPEIFIGAAEKLASYRRTHFPGGINPQVIVIRLQEVYDNFGYGMPDPTSVRNYLKWASENYDPIPSYVLFMGSGTYDYRNIERRSPFRGVFPVHEEGGKIKYFSMQDFNNCFDDWFVDFDGDRYPDMCVGRITAVTNLDINQNVEKIIKYENSSSFGPWKSRVLFLADDEYASRVSQSYNEYIHNYQTESISTFLSMDYQPVKVYLMNYLGTNQTAGPPYNYNPGEKPLAAQDLKQEVNKGCFMWLFMGHGNLTVLSHENVFRSPSDVDVLENEIRQPICYFGSCGVGAFDRTTYSSLADGIQLSHGKGAVFTWGSSRATYPSDNYPLAVNLLVKVIEDRLSTGEAALVTKNQIHANSWNYLNFGDPALITVKDSTGIVLGLERGSQSLMSSGNLSLTSGDRFPVTSTDPVSSTFSLVPVDTVKGRVTYSLTGTIDDPSFGDGWVSVIVMPPQRPDSHDYMHRAVPLPSDFTYYFSDQFIPGLPVYEVLTTVKSNSFTATFTTPPKLIKSGDQSNMRRFMIYAYAWNSAKEARGSLELPCSGTDEQPSGDSAAPKVYALVKGRILSDSGDMVQNPLDLELVFEDQSGINLTPIPENVLFVQLDNGSLDTLAGRFFKYDMSSSMIGRIKKTFNFGNESGEHKLTVAVSDNLGNRGIYTWFFNVESSSAPDITNIMNFPNPMENTTNFTFILTSGFADIKIEIYTVTGKLIKVIEAGEVTSGFNSVFWNGLDAEGDRPANGVYLYRVVARTRSSESSGSEREISKIGKIFIAR